MDNTGSIYNNNLAQGVITEASIVLLTLTAYT